MPTKSTTKTTTTRKLTRVDLARDVIKMLAAKKLVAQRGVYFTNEEITQEDKPKNLKSLLQELNKPCEVCALGALFVANVDRRNAITVQDGYYCPDSEGYRQKLADIFPKAELFLIEDAFEGFAQSSTEGINREVVQAAHRFRYSILNDEERMIRIMKNIIRHRRFRPELEKW